MKVSIVKRGAGFLLALIMLVGILPAVPVFADEGIVFKTLGTDWPGYNPASDSEEATNPDTFNNQAFNQAMSYSKDMPVFDGVPEHLDAFLDTYLDWVGLEGAILYTLGLRDSYRMVLDTESPAYGKLIPGGLAAADNANGISNNSAPTDFPTFNAQGSTWNPDLMQSVGEVIGKEKMITLQTEMNRNRNRHNASDWSKLSGTQSTTIAFGVLTDMHVNPLAGRADEGYGEDVYHMGVLANAQAEGFVGYNDGKASNSGSTDDETFYTRGVISTKHPSVYTTEWFRQTANNSVGARGMYEWQVAGPLKGYESGAIMGGMTSFGRTNGIANEISSYNILYNQVSKYGYYSSPDFRGETYLFATQGSSNGMGNGYDKRYVEDRAHSLALMSLANTEAVHAMDTDQSDVAEVYDLVMRGGYGITEEAFRNSAKGLLANMVRAGLFDEIDSNGFPVHYPYVDESRDGTDADYKANNANGTVQEHIDTALQSAQEAIVVLKSDGRLPSVGDNVAVAGHYADTRYIPQTAYSSTVSYTSIPYSGVTPLLAMAELYKEAGVATPSESISFSQGAQVITIEDNQGRYLTAPVAAAGSTLSFEAPMSGSDVARQQFEMFDMGQDAILLRSVHNGRWVTNATSPANTTAQATNNFVLTTDLDAGVMSGTNKITAIPPRLGRIRHSDTVYSLYSGYTDAYISTGLRMLQSTDAGAFTAVSGTFQVDMSTAEPERRFTFNQVASPGAEAIEIVDDAEAALIFVGAHARNSAGEGKDRTSMAMGSTDYQLVKDVAAAYAAAGKPAIVVVRSSYVMLMQDPNSSYNIQADPNVSTVLYQSFGGRYEGLAMAQALLGQVIPSGRMSTSWYMSDDVLPAYDWEYSIPEGASDAYVNGGESYVGYRFQKYDLTNADPQETRLTYMYADPADVQYEFGYGVNINPDFYIPDDLLALSAPASARADSTFTVSIDATNVGVGNADGVEVFQLYAKKIDPAYGDAAPRNKLIAFQKVELPAGASANIQLTVDPQDLAVWDVNSGSYIVEEGAYELQLGYSAYDIRKTATINITGGGAAPITTLNPSEFFNVFDHSFTASNVVYLEASKLRTVESLKAQAIAGGYSAVMSKGDGAYVAIPKVNLTGMTELSAYVATNKAEGDIELWADAPNASAGGTKIATIEVPMTEVVYVDADGIPNNTTNWNTATLAEPVDEESSELGYALVEVETSGEWVGTHDVYVVFKAANLRIDTLQIPVESVEDNREELRALYNDLAGMEYDADLYTTGSVARFETALAEAERLLEEEIVTDAEVAAAMEELLAASVLQLRASANAVGWLEFVISLYDGFDQEMYTADSWAIFASALADAKAILADADNATEEEVENAADALSTAGTDLVPLYGQLDKSLLQFYIDEAEDLLANGDLTPITRQTLESVLAGAKTALDSDYQETIDAACDALLAAINAARAKGDKSILERLVILARAYQKGLYTDASWQNFTKALNLAETVLADENMGEEEVAYALSTLGDAMRDLEYPPANLASLKAAIRQAEVILANADSYVASTLVGLQEALDAANAVLNKTGATQAEVNAATQTLAAANAKARLKADLSALEGLMKVVGRIDLDLYTPESVAPLNMAMARAAAMTIENTQVEVDAAHNDVLEKKNNLELKPELDVNTGGGTGTDAGTNTNAGENTNTGTNANTNATGNGGGSGNGANYSSNGSGTGRTVIINGYTPVVPDAGADTGLDRDIPDVVFDVPQAGLELDEQPEDGSMENLPEAQAANGETPLIQPAVPGQQGINIWLVVLVAVLAVAVTGVVTVVIMKKRSKKSAEKD